MFKTVVILVISLAIAAGCSRNRSTSVALQPVLTLKDLLVPSKGIITVDGVKVVHRGGYDYELAGASTALFGSAELTAIIYCRASRLAKTSGYVGWYPQMNRHQIWPPEGLRTINAIITLVPLEYPKEASRSESEIDWCKKVPQ